MPHAALVLPGRNPAADRALPADWGRFGGRALPADRARAADRALPADRARAANRALPADRARAANRALLADRAPRVPPALSAAVPLANRAPVAAAAPTCVPVMLSPPAAALAKSAAVSRGPAPADWGVYPELPAPRYPAGVEVAHCWDRELLAPQVRAVAAAARTDRDLVEMAAVWPPHPHR